MEYLTLHNGVKMPALGIGTFLMTPAQAEDAVYNALQCGYPMIDTANAYMNEKAVGRGMRKSGVAREDVFLVTKLWPSVYTDGTAVDKAKSIGISNFHGEKLEKLLSECEIAPHVIQMEAHPYCTQDEIKARLAQYGTVTMAWYPLGHGDKSLINEPVFADLAKKYGKSSAQVILRWHTQMGHAVIPGSTNPAHIRDNADIFDFTLTAEEMAEIAKINKNVRYYHATPEQEENYAAFAPDFDGQE